MALFVIYPLKNIDREMKRDAILATQMEAIIKQVQVIERFGCHLAMFEACETMAGVMGEQIELITLAERSCETQLKDWAKDKTTNGRAYSGHISAIRDAMRLSKLVMELIEQVNSFTDNGGLSLIDKLKTEISETEKNVK